MSTVDELPPDQQAALSLLLRTRKSYADVAALLHIPESAVHDRAHAALAVLAPREARALDAQRREEIGEYLLGQQAALAERLATRSMLARTPEARAWAQQLHDRLAPLADGNLPEIPAAAAAVPAAAAPAGAESAGAPAPARVPEGPGPPSPPREPSPAHAPGAQRAAGALPSSRVGGAILLAVIVAAVVVAVVLITGGGSSHSKGGSTSASTKGASTKGASASTGSPKVDARLALKAPSGSSAKTIALVEVLSESSKTAFYIAAEHLPPSGHGVHYVIWLYNSPTSFEGLSVAAPVGSDEKLAGGSFLPENASQYSEMIVTREHTEKPTHPGHIVLQGAFSLTGS